MILIADLTWSGLPLASSEFVAPIEDLVGAEEDFITLHYSRVGGRALIEADAVILSGAPLKDFGFLENPDFFEWVGDFERPILGICAGMQALSLAYGSKIYDCEEIGFTDVKTLAPNPLFGGSFQAYCLHKKAVKPSPSFEVLAASKSCIQAVKHKRKSQYGVLFHPEVRNSQIISSFLRLV